MRLLYLYAQLPVDEIYKRLEFLVKLYTGITQDV